MSNTVELPVDILTPKFSNWSEEEIIPTPVELISSYWIVLFLQIPESYSKYCFVVGALILTSVISPKLLIVEVPPPDPPTVFLNKPALIMLA